MEPVEGLPRLVTGALGGAGDEAETEARVFLRRAGSDGGAALLAFANSSSWSRRATLASGDVSENPSSSSSVSLISFFLLFGADFMEYMLFRSPRSLSGAFWRDGPGRCTSNDEEDLLRSVAAGVGTMLVPGVEYSLSDKPSTGVGAVETDSLPSSEARLGLPRPLLVGAVAGEMALSAASVVFLGRPLGRFSPGAEVLRVSAASATAVAGKVTRFLVDVDRVKRPVPVDETSLESEILAISE